jgi:ligand-binding sensor domain-containing protein
MYYIRGISVLGTNIRCINADSKHFLWAGSQDGLFKFDSKEAFEFNGNGLDKYRLGGSDIRDMSFDGTHLWLTSTQGGIDRINTINSQVDLHLSQDQFPTLENGSITSICKEKEILYVGTERGLYYYNIFRHLVVLLRDIGIYVYNIENNELLDTVTTVSPTLKYHRFYSVAQGPSGQYYLGTSRGLSKIFVGSNGHLTYLETPFGISKKLILNDIYAVALDKQKKLWCSTENFLLTINIVSGDYAKVENAIENTENFLKSVYSIYCDSDDNIWLGCQSGLFYLKNAPPSSVVYHKSRVGAAVINNAYYPFPVNDSLLLVTGENGIYKINRQNGVITEVDISGAYDFVLRDPFNKIFS